MAAQLARPIGAGQPSREDDQRRQTACLPLGVRRGRPRPRRRPRDGDSRTASTSAGHHVLAAGDDHVVAAARRRRGSPPRRCGRGRRCGASRRRRAPPGRRSAPGRGSRRPRCGGAVVSSGRPAEPSLRSASPGPGSSPASRSRSGRRSGPRSRPGRAPPRARSAGTGPAADQDRARAERSAPASSSRISWVGTSETTRDPSSVEGASRPARCRSRRWSTAVGPVDRPSAGRSRVRRRG